MSQAVCKAKLHEVVMQPETKTNISGSVNLVLLAIKQPVLRPGSLNRRLIPKMHFRTLCI